MIQPPPKDITVEREFVIGPRQQVSRSAEGESPWQCFKKDPADWVLSTAVLTITVMVGVLAVCVLIRALA